MPCTEDDQTSTVYKDKTISGRSKRRVIKMYFTQFISFGSISLPREETKRETTKKEKLHHSTRRKKKKGSDGGKLCQIEYY